MNTVMDEIEALIAKKRVAETDLGWVGLSGHAAVD